MLVRRTGARKLIGTPHGSIPGTGPGPPNDPLMPRSERGRAFASAILSMCAHRHRRMARLASSYVADGEGSDGVAGTAIRPDRTKAAPLHLPHRGCAPTARSSRIRQLD